VVALLDGWAAAMHLPAEEAKAWHDAGVLHDALRDAQETQLRELTRDEKTEVQLLHGPAAAERLEADGETRADVIQAVRWHTIGCAAWGRVGRALYMADFLDPGRGFAKADRAYLARQVPTDFDGTFRQVVRMRVEWAVREGKGLHVETVALWNSVR
jgi:2-amino-4-hydroxy-6-hydroxymethyldihydropteridine diphosphokinase